MARRLICKAMVALLGVSVCSAGVEVPLTVTERAGVARVSNHVNSGVPLPVGAVRDAGELGLFTPDGKRVNAQITERCRWLKDKSLKFVTVHFACDVAAKGAAKYVLKTAKGAPAATIKITAAEDAVTVDTGVLRFVVRKKGFNLFDQVWLNGREVVAPGTAALKLLATEGKYEVAKNVAKLLTESDPFETTAVAKAVEVEEAGPVRAVVKVSGAFMKGEQKTLDFLARIYALAGSSSVRVAFTVVNRVGKEFSTFVGVKELSISMPLKGLGGETRYSFGAVKDPDISARLAKGGKATLLQLASTDYTVNGKKYPGGRAEDSRRLGWANLTGEKAGLAVGVRNFWQLHPKGLEVAADGTVRVMLVAGGAGESRAGAEGVPMFTGGARTHEVLFAFHEGTAGRARAMGVVDPLFARAPTDWYCQKTQGFGRLYDDNLDNFKPEHRELVKGFQANLDRSFASVVSWKDGKKQKGLEEYGFFNYGCNVHHGTVVAPGSWLDTGWNGNYYDFPFALMVNFVRTGNEAFWRYAQAHALHVADIDVCHWHPANQKLNGIEHVCYSIGHFRKFWRGYPFGISGNADSTKNQSLYHLYYMTGDRWFLDVALLVSDYNAVHGGGALRAVGNRMTGLFGSYEATHDPKHFQRWKGFVVKQGVGRAKSRGLRSWDQDWMYGLAAEGLMTYYRVTGELEAAEAVRTCCDSLIRNFWVESKKATKTALNGFTANCFGYAYELTGDAEYLAKGLTQLAAANQRGAGRSKSFAQQFRLSPQLLHYLAKDYVAPKPVLTERRVIEVGPKPPKPATPRVVGKRGEFPAVRDARITCHPSEQELNSGGGTRLRARNINSRSAELTLLDFDTGAIGKFIEANKGKELKATLLLNVMELRNVPATLRVMALQSATDWREGVGTQAKCNRGDVCFVWAQFQTARWRDKGGKEVPDLRAALYDRQGKKVLTLENSKSVAVEKGAKRIEVPLDSALVSDLVSNEGNRGLVLFTAQSVDGPQAILDFRSRETRGGAAILKLEAQE